MFRSFLVRTLLVVALTIVSVACIGNVALADLVLRPTGVTTVSGDLSVMPFANTIDNSGLTGGATVNSGVAPNPWPTSDGNHGGADAGRFYKGGTTELDEATLNFAVPSSLTGHPAIQITGVRMWNWNEYWGQYYNNRGIASALVKYSTDGGTSWDAGQTLSFTQAANTPTVTSELVALSGLPTGVTNVKFQDMSGLGPDGYIGFLEVRFVGVPEPGTLALLTSGLIGLLCYAWRKRK